MYAYPMMAAGAGWALPRQRHNSSCMDKLDRLDWAAGLAFTASGARVGVRVSDPAALDALMPLLPPGWAPAARPEVDYLFSLVVGGEARPGLTRFTLLYGRSNQLVRTQSLAEALAAFEQNVHAIAAVYARTRVFVRAGVVGWRGRAILLPGRAGAGELVAALVRAGATYYSGMFAPLDRRGLVHPYPLKLSLCHDGAFADPVPRRVGRRPIRAALVAALERRAGATCAPQPLSRGRAVLALLDSTLLARLDSRRSLDACRQATDGAAAVEGYWDDADAAARALLDLLDRTNTT